MNSHLFSSDDGNLYDTRKPEWNKSEPLRTNHTRTHRTINNARELCATLRAGAYAWPGGYTIALITSDGEMASIAGLLANRGDLYQAIYDIHTNQHSRIVGADIYYEGPTVQCVYTNADIESAYGETDE